MSIPGRILNKILGRFPYVNRLQKRLHFLEKDLAFDPGHYYSPVVSADEYEEQQKELYASENYLPPEIDLNEKVQAGYLEDFKEFYASFPFTDADPSRRFRLDNMFFTYSDAYGLYAMMRKLKPKKIIEIGSGFSSALLLDVNEIFFNNSIDCTFIDPNPERLKTNIRPGEQLQIIEKKIQHISPGLFQSLEAGDFLLIDTSHVAKSGSDVNHIYFNILPFIKPGVFIHIHDVFFPFEYPAQWIIKENRSWNEIFLLRAFLAFNPQFKIEYFNSFMEKKHRAYFEEQLPLLLKRNETVCGGIWLKKIQ